eukprot:6663077-Prymnesium_polylepis.1
MASLLRRHLVLASIELPQLLSRCTFIFLAVPAGGGTLKYLHSIRVKAAVGVEGTPFAEASARDAAKRRRDHTL